MKQHAMCIILSCSDSVLPFSMRDWQPLTSKTQQNNSTTTTAGSKVNQGHVILIGSSFYLDDLRLIIIVSLIDASSSLFRKLFNKKRNNIPFQFVRQRVSIFLEGLTRLLEMQIPQTRSRCFIDKFLSTRRCLTRLSWLLTTVSDVPHLVTSFLSLSSCDWVQLTWQKPKGSRDTKPFDRQPRVNLTLITLTH